MSSVTRALRIFDARLRRERPAATPTTLGPPGAPPECAGRLREGARWEWRRGEPGDPALRLEHFLHAHGVPVRELATGDGATGPDPEHHRQTVCGATLMLSAAGSARLAGAAGEAPEPAAAVPDLVAVVWEHLPDRQVPVTPPVGSPGWELGPWEHSWTSDQHAAAVGSVRDAIACGDVYQVNVVGHAAAPYRGDPVAALRRVASLRGARYAGVLQGSGWAVACASPETLVRVRGDQVWTCPIKGTRAATDAGRIALLGSEKERAEHVMIVDLGRNDLAQVAVTGSVRVPELYAVRRWCDLWQAESRICGRLAGGVGLAGLLRAVCPGGSVTGAPKRAALDRIAAVEPVGRGPAMGALGWVGHGCLDLGLTIRTVAVDGERVHLWAGGGITWGSDPQAEVTEAAAKAGPIRAALARRSG